MNGPMRFLIFLLSFSAQSLGRNPVKNECFCSQNGISSKGWQINQGIKFWPYLDKRANGFYRVMVLAIISFTI